MLRVGLIDVVLLAHQQDYAALWPVVNFDTFYDRDAAKREDLRRVVVHISHLGSAFYYVLWWGDRQVPVGLDERIASDTVAVEDLADACAAEFGGITCLYCHAQYYALTCDGGNPLLRITRPPPPESWQHECPVCKERQVLPILEIIEPRPLH
jgi:NAD(P)-dependent dehydrogenase (short-subunit alcohol dehydrogenase family)